MGKINLSGFTNKDELLKSHGNVIEGIYADTPENRHKGIVGKKYSDTTLNTIENNKGIEQKMKSDLLKTSSHAKKLGEVQVLKGKPYFVAQQGRRQEVEGKKIWLPYVYEIQQNELAFKKVPLTFSETQALEDLSFES